MYYINTQEFHYIILVRLNNMAKIGGDVFIKKELQEELSKTLPKSIRFQDLQNSNTQRFTQTL